MIVIVNIIDSYYYYIIIIIILIIIICKHFKYLQTDCFTITVYCCAPCFC
jgi:hypothetical protein